MSEHNERSPMRGGFNLYRVEMMYDGSHYVVAYSFDDAVRRLHEHMYEAGQWPREAATPEDADAGRWSYRTINKITNLGTVIL